MHTPQRSPNRRQALLGLAAAGAVTLGWPVAASARQSADAQWTTDTLIGFAPIDGAGANGSPVFGPDGKLYMVHATGGQHNLGTLSRWSPVDGSLLVLHHFNYAADDGFEPESGVIVGSDKRLWGTTLGGGQFFVGTLYAFSLRDGTFEIMAEFGGSDAGHSPIGGLVEGHAGHFYGTTSETVYRFDRRGSGKLKAVHRFKDTTDGFGSQASLTLGPKGWLYGTNPLGGPKHHGTVFRVAPDGSAFELLASLDGHLEGDQPDGQLLRASNGDFYGIARTGGQFDKGVVFRVGSDGSYDVLHHFSGGLHDGAYPDAGLVEGPDGALYGSTVEGGDAPASYGTIYRLTKRGKFSLLHRFGENDPAGGTPAGNLVFGPDGRLYGTDQGYAANGAGALYRLTPPAA